MVCFYKRTTNRGGSLDKALENVAKESLYESCDGKRSLENGSVRIVVGTKFPFGIQQAVWKGFGTVNELVHKSVTG